MLIMFLPCLSNHDICDFLFSSESPTRSLIGSSVFKFEHLKCTNFRMKKKFFEKYFQTGNARTLSPCQTLSKQLSFFANFYFKVYQIFIISIFRFTSLLHFSQNNLDTILCVLRSCSFFWKFHQFQVYLTYIGHHVLCLLSEN